MLVPATIRSLGFRALCLLVRALPEPRAQRPKALSPDDSFRQLSFTFALIALSARVACADGKLTSEKYLAFREVFPLKSGICGKIRELFSLACSDTTPTAHYANQILSLYPGKQDLYAAVVDKLFRIAAADGHISEAEEWTLTEIAQSLQLGAGHFSTLLARYHRPAAAHAVLGVPADITASALKKRYHELMRRYHPDRLATEAASPELRLLLKLKSTEINDAYRVLMNRLSRV